jgi:formylglycine-generating enzyme
VGRKKANAWGLFDMQGNVWEWCADFYDANYYRSSPADDPLKVTNSEARSLRGAAWARSAWDLRISNRNRNQATHRNDNFGFRCVREGK